MRCRGGEIAIEISAVIAAGAILEGIRFSESEKSRRLRNSEESQRTLQSDPHHGFDNADAAA